MREINGKINEGYIILYRRIANAILRADVNVTELKILIAIICYTYGFRREECKMTARYLSEITCKSLRVVQEAIKTLCNKKMLVKRYGKNQKDLYYSLGEKIDLCESQHKSCADNSINICAGSNVNNMQKTAHNKYNIYNKNNNYKFKADRYAVPTPKATAFSNFTSRHNIDYKKLELEALQRRHGVLQKDRN